MARRAQLVYLARNAANAQEIMNSVAAVYGEARGNPMFPTIARASAIGLLNLPAKPEYANVAQEAIRGFLLLGDKRRTEAWTKLALTAAVGIIVRSLREAGEDEAARLFAIEIAIAHGL